MVKAKKTPSTKTEPRSLRAGKVQFGFIEAPKAPDDQPREVPPSPPDTPAQREHDKIMREIADLRTTIGQTLTGEYRMTRAPRDGLQDIDAALTEAFPDGNYPRAYAAKREKLTPIYKREKLGDVPDRFVIGRAIKRLKRT